MPAPKTLQRCDRAERILDAPRRQAPVEHRADVVELALQSLQPLCVSESRKLGLGGSRQREESFGVFLTELLELSLGVESGDGMLAHRLQHRQPDLPVCDIAAEQAPGDERLEIGEETRLGTGDRTSVGERAPAHEDGERLVQRALPVVQEPVAPLDRRAERALALGKVDRPLHLQCQPFVERFEDLRGRKHHEACSDQLDRQRQSVEPLADSPHGRHGVLSQEDSRAPPPARRRDPTHRRAEVGRGARHALPRDEAGLDSS